MKRSIFAVVLIFTMLLSWSPPVSAAGEPIRVVATIFPLTDIVRQIGGNRVSVTTLLTGGMSAHMFEPTTAQVRLMSQAVLYVRIGAHLDPWGDKLLAAAKSPPLIVTATAGVPLLRVEHQELGAERQGAHHHHDEGDDPHMWLDPVLVRKHVVPAVLGALIRLSPGDAGYFRENAAGFSRSLAELDDELRRSIGALRNKEFIALHGAWHYFSKRYGLRQIAAVEPFPGKEPSAKYIAALVKMARSKGVKIIFAEPQLSAKAARVIAGELDGRVLLLDPLGGDSLPGRSSYTDLMRYNLSVIAQGMK